MLNEIEERTKEEPQPDSPDLRSELATLLNRHSRENVSNTPDFILRDYMWDALKAFERGVKRREEWYGITDDERWPYNVELTGRRPAEFRLHSTPNRRSG